MIEFFIAIPIIFIIGIFCTSAYKYFQAEKAKANKRKCRLDKYNR